MDSVIVTTRALISEIDSSGIYRAANPALARALDRSVDEVVGRSIRDLHPPEIARVFQERIDTVVADRRPLDVEDRIDGPDGPVFFQSTLSPIFGGSDTQAPVRSVGIVSQEISARVASEEAARREAKRFRSVFDSVTTVAVQGYDSCGATTYWNPASEALYGYTADEALGTSLLDLIIPIEMREAVSQEIEQMFATGAPISSSELLLQRKDGSRVPVFSSHALVSVPGEGPEMYCLDVDLSELHRSRELFRTIAEIAPVGIVLSDRDERVQYVNARFTEMFGYTRADMPSVQEWWTLAYPDPALRQRVQAEWIKRLRRATETQSDIVELEYPVTCKDGTVKLIEFRAKSSGELNVVLFSDITTRRQALDALEAALEEKDVLLREIHHRIKNNFASVQALLSMQLHQADGPAVAALREAESRVAGMRVLYDKLLESGRYERVSSRGYLEDLCGHVLAAYGTDGRIALTLAIIDVELDARRAFALGAIVTELMTNSIKYAFPDKAEGGISVSLESAESGFVLRVQDSGRGMPPSFDARSDGGFGLTLVRAMTGQIGGELLLDSSTGTGTCWTVPFPLN